MLPSFPSTSICGIYVVLERWLSSTGPRSPERQDRRGAQFWMPRIFKLELKTNLIFVGTQFVPTSFGSTPSQNMHRHTQTHTHSGRHHKCLHLGGTETYQSGHSSSVPYHSFASAFCYSSIIVNINAMCIFFFFFYFAFLLDKLKLYWKLLVAKDT